MKLRIALLPGDGIGPEVTAEAVRVLRAVAELHGCEFIFDERLIGGAAIRRAGTPLPVTTLDACLASDAVLLGAVGSPAFDQLPPHARPEAGLLTLRRALGGYANLRPVVCYEATADCSPLRPEVVAGADVLIVRELLGGLYFGEPRGFTGDGSADEATATAAETIGAYNTMRYTVAEVERVAHIAFQAAARRRGKVTSVDKANVLETSQLWRRTVARVGANYPHVVLEHQYVDACAMHLMMRPRDFDVLLTENLFGDILSDEAAVLAGSLGLLASATVGGAVALYEPVHGSAPDIAGRGAANPCGAIASAALLLRHSARLDAAADDIDAALRQVLAAGHRTADLQRGRAPATTTTAEFGALVVEALAEIADRRHAYHAV
jgi:3-isopropylmalate dehydrogenase